MPEPTVTKITETSTLQRVFNHESAVAWINQSLVSRATCDVRKNVCLYDADKDFMMMIVADVGELTEEDCANLAARTRVRFWSKGIV